MSVDRSVAKIRSQSPLQAALRIDFQAWLWLLLLLAAFCAYAPALRGGLLWDDDAHVTKPALQSLAGLGRIWFELGATQQYYPILHSAFWLEHRWWGDATLGYHVVNVLLHVAAALLLVRILQRLSIPGAWLAAFVFTLHPVQVESVAWITELKNVLSTVFYLSAALSYLRFDETRRTRHYWGALAFFACALLTKSVTATLPAALLVVFWWKRGRLDLRRDIAPLLPWLVFGATTGLFTAWVERKYIGAEGADYALNLLQRTLLAGRVVWFYAGKLLWPADQSFIYPRWDIDPTAVWSYVFPLAAAGLIFAAWRLRQRMRGPLAGLLFFGGTLVPVLGFFNVYPFRYSYVADHFQYLACLGLIVLGAAAVAQATARLGTATRVVGAAALVLMLCAATAKLAANYRDNRHLFESVLALNPRCWMAHGNLGDELAQTGEADAAAAQFTEALRLNPDYYGASNNLGHLLLQQRRVADALPYFENALRMHPKFLEARVNLSHALLLSGRLNEAANHAMIALINSPASAAAEVCVADVQQMTGHLASAIGHYQRALALDPKSFDAHANLGFALLAKGDFTTSIDHSTTALRLDPKSAVAHNNLGNALLSLEKLAAAADQFQSALALDPNYAEAHQNLAVALRRNGQTAAAITHAEAALRLRPETPEIRINLALALIDAGRSEEARAHWAEAKKMMPSLPPMPSPGQTGSRRP